MNTDLLQRFCGNEARGRYDLSRPFWRGGYVWATDGRICARMAAPGADDCPQGEKPYPDLASLWSNWVEPTRPLPQMTGHTEELTEDCDCEWVRCWRCFGHGCRECSGGMRPDLRCAKCHGAGEYRYTRPAPQPVLAGWIAGHYAALLHELPEPVLVGFKPVPTPTTYEGRTRGGIYSWRCADGLEGLVGCVQITRDEAGKWARVVDAKSATKE